MAYGLFYFMASPNEPRLAPPGAGLPFPQRWVARWVIPFQAKRSLLQDNLTRFEKYSRSIEDRAQTLTTDQLNTRFLVRPILGLEDSSRYWSPAMILDHLMITGPHFYQILSELSYGRVPPVQVRVENVKPPAQTHDLDIIQKYHRFWTGFVPTLKLGPDLHGTRLRHPWFGPLSAHQWLHVLSLHHGVHLQQFKQIVASFRS